MTPSRNNNSQPSKRLAALVPVAPEKPLNEMTDAEFEAYLDKVYDEQVAPALEQEPPGAP